MRTIVAVLFTLVLAAPAAAAWSPEPAKYGVAEQHNVPVTMSDGTILRADVYSPANADGAGLSRRELEVVRLLSGGATNREIAEQLVVSRRTVDMHVRNILRKLDCRSRMEAVTRAGEIGLLARS